MGSAGCRRGGRSIGAERCRGRADGVRQHLRVMPSEPCRLNRDRRAKRRGRGTEMTPTQGPARACLSGSVFRSTAESGLYSGGV